MMAPQISEPHILCEQGITQVQDCQIILKPTIDKLTLEYRSWQLF